MPLLTKRAPIPFALQYAWRPSLDSGSTVLERGYGAPSFTRATAAFLPYDHEGKSYPVLSGEVRFPGMRRVRNWVPDSTNLQSASWVTLRSTSTSGALAPDGTNTAFTITATAANGYYYVSPAAPYANPTVTISIWLRRRTGTGTVALIQNAAVSRTDITTRLTTTWKRFSVTTGTLATSNIYCGIDIYTSGDEVDMWQPMAELVDGQSNQNPSEYVSVGVAKLNEFTNTEALTLWTQLATPATTQNGFLGNAVAFDLTDDAAGGFEGISHPNYTVPNDSATRYAGLRVKKTSGGTAPILGINLIYQGGASPVSYFFRLNTDTGASAYLNAFTSVVDRGTYWDVVVAGANNSTGNTTFRMEIYPATASAGGVVDTAAAVGTATVAAPWACLTNTGYFPVGNVYPFHGACVDGVRYFNTTNGNSVTNNVVTEAVGEYIPKSGLGWAYNTGVVGAVYSTPHAAPHIPVSGDVVIIEYVGALESWNTGAFQILAGKWTGAVSTSSYQLGISSAGLAYMSVSNGSVNTAINGSAPGFVAGQLGGLRAVWTVGTEVQFQTSTDGGATWANLASPIALTTLPLAGTMDFRVSAQTTSSFPARGTTMRARLSINGTTVLDFNPTNWNGGDAFTGGMGEVWKLNGGAAVRKWPRGYLPEEATTNLVLQSENFGTTWSAGGATTPTRVAATARCGSIVLDTLGDDDAAQQEYYFQAITLTGDAVKGFSFFFKQGTATSTAVGLIDQTAAAYRALAIITWSDGTPTVAMTNGTLLGLDAQADGVWRARVASTVVTAANVHQVRVYPANVSAGDPVHVGTIQLGGVQVENKTFCTSYVKTTTTTVTRNAEALFYPAAGNVTGSVGSMSVDYVAGLNTAASPTSFILHINDGTEAERLVLYLATGNARYIATDGAVSQAGAGTPIAEGIAYRGAMRWGTNDYAFGHNGVIINTDTVGSTPTITQITIGQAAAGGSHANGIIQDARVWNRTASDTDLKTLTYNWPGAPIFEYNFLNSSNSNPIVGGGTTTISTSANGTYVNSVGVITQNTANALRFDHDPVSRQLKGVLIEQASTNLLLRSGTMSTAFWGPIDATWGELVTAPDGTATMAKLVENSANTQHYTSQVVGKAASAIQYTVSVFLKAAGRNFARLRIDGNSSNGAYVDINLSTGVVGTATGMGVAFTGLTAAAEYWGDGVYRLALTATSDTAAAVRVVVQPIQGFGLNSYLGDGSSGIYVWGTQLEALGFMTSYIPTTTVAVTRAKDDVSLTLGTWYNHNSGTVLTDFMKSTLANSLNGRVVSFNEGLGNERHDILTTIGSFSVSALTHDGGVPQANIAAASAITLNVPCRTVYGYALNDFAISANNGTVGVDTGGTLPTNTVMEIGAITASAHLNGWVRRIQYWPYKINNDIIQALSNQTP
jgi:hypothetical protein